MAQSEVWQKLDAETPRNYHAFTLYRDLGQRRSIKAVATSLGKGEGYFEVLSRRHNWVSRATAWDIHLDSVALERQEQSHLEELEAYRKRTRSLATIATENAVLMFDIVRMKLRAAHDVAKTDPDKLMIDSKLATWGRAASLISQAASNAEATALGIDKLIDQFQDDEVEDDES